MFNVLTKKTFLIKNIFCFLLIFIFSLSVYDTNIAKSQVGNSGDLNEIMKDEKIELIFSPDNPVANSVFRANLRSYSIDINTSEIIWLINGKEYSRGRGLNSIEIRTGDPGNELIIKAIIKDGTSTETIEKTLNPGVLDILWTTDSYTPPFFKGLPLYSFETKIILTAIPTFKTKTGKIIPSNELVFQWRDGINALSNESGKGKNRLIIKGNIIDKPKEITVKVFSPEYSLTAEKIIAFEPIIQEAEFYEVSPLYGILWNKAFGNEYSMSQSEIEVLSVPYYFSKDSVKNGKIVYGWTIGNQISEQFFDKKSIVLKTKNDKDGYSSISINLTAKDKILQKAYKKSVLKIIKSANKTDI